MGWTPQESQERGLRPRPARRARRHLVERRTHRVRDRRRVSERTLVVDFDGTITEQDLLDEIALTFEDEDVYREVDEGLDDHSLTLHEVIRREFEPVSAPLREVQEWVLENVRVRPGFGEVVQLARERGWRFVIVSSGFRELIEPVLERESRQRRAPLEYGRPGSGRLEGEVPGLGDLRGLRAAVQALDCGGPRRRHRARLRRRRLLGQVRGRAADLVFARRGLARYLEEQGVPFERFDDFHSIARRLAS